MVLVETEHLDLTCLQQLLLQQQPVWIKRTFCSRNVIKIKIEITVKYDLTGNLLSLPQKLNNENIHT